MKNITARFTLETEFIGVEWTDDVDFEFEDDATDEEIKMDIQAEFEFWLDDKLADFRAQADYEIL